MVAQTTKHGLLVKRLIVYLCLYKQGNTRYRTANFSPHAVSSTHTQGRCVQASFCDDNRWGTYILFTMMCICSALGCIHHQL